MDAELSTCVWNQIECSGSVERRVLERSCHTATVVGDHVYVIGGKRRSHFYDDVIRLNLKTHTWETVFSSLPFLKRANHSAVLVGKNIWVVGGMSVVQVYQDVHVLDTETMEWSTAKLEGNTFLLKRCAHAACLHPTHPNAILLFGGYGGRATAKGTYSFLNDLVMIKTDRKSIELVKCTSARNLPGRAYHTFVAVGPRCFSIGGKDRDGITSADHFLEVFDTRNCRWLSPPTPSGQSPVARSSHKAGVVDNAILITGGVGVADAEQRFDDTAVLSVSEGNGGSLKLSWNSASIAGGGPAARSAHALVVHRQGVLLLLGYTGGNTYLSDVWILQSGSRQGPVSAKAGQKVAVGDNGVSRSVPTREPLVKATSGLASTTGTTSKPSVKATPGVAPITSTTSAKGTRANGLLMLSGLSRTPPKTHHVRFAGMGNVNGLCSPAAATGADNNTNGAKGAGGNATTISSPGSKRPQQTTPEWRTVKRSKAQETPQPLATPVLNNERTLDTDTIICDLVAEEGSPRHDTHPQPASSSAADAVYIKKIKELEAQVSFLQSTSKESRSQEAKLRTRCVGLEAQVQDLTQERERLQQLLSTTKKAVETKDQLVVQAQQKLKAAQEQLARSQEKANTLQLQLQSAQHDAGAAAAESAARISTLQREVVELKHQVAARTASSQQYQALADQRRKDAESVRHQLAELQGKLAEAGKQLAATTQEKQQLEGMLREKDAATARLNACVDKLREESKRECIMRERKIAEQAASLEQTKVENASLISAHDKLQDSLKSLSRAMESAQKEVGEERRLRAEAAESSARERAALMHRLEESERKLAASEPELLRLKTVEEQNTEHIQRLTGDLQGAKEREAALEAQLAQATAEITELRGENVQLNQQVDSLRSVGAPLLGEARSLQAVVSTLVDKIREQHSVLEPPTPAVP